jgi:tetratricopeptide (TPR) repeat protein
MAKVPLRAYNREIETMIDRGQLDEAIAHCHHILKTFPKHLETYRLLGKAYLEYKRHGDAADIFSRVLVSVPNDFVSQVGMSIIRDEENKLDDAIWHMERAFETQPSNSAIQGELQRLYGRRDGVQPPRIRMTRGALAHMYVQGELYPQAISEIRSVLKEDAGRSDMEALLARACYKSGLKNDAADVATALLRRYPYALDANRVLAEILGVDRPENAQAYRQRVVELDPYAAQVTGSIFSSNEVPDAAVSLERLDWNGQPVRMQSDWSETQAISLEAGTTADEQPEWLRSSSGDMTPPPLSQATPASIFDTSTPPMGTPSAPADDIPDFMRQAGWGQSTGAFDERESALPAEEPAAAESLEQGDLPDWVRAMKPAEPAVQQEAEEELPDWINKIGAGAISSQDADTALPDWMNESEPAASASEEKPDWLNSLEGAAEQAPPTGLGAEFDWLKSPGSEPEPTAPAVDAEAEDLDWLKGLGSEVPQTPPVTQADDVDWLMNLGSEPAAIPPAAQTEEPDWLKGFASETESEPASPVSDEEQPAWLDQLSAETEPVPSTSVASDFDFLEQLTEEPILETPSDSVVSTPDVNNLGVSEQERDDSFAWLEALAAKQGASEGLLTRPEERLDEEPEWVKQAKGLSAGPPPSPVESPVSEALTPDEPVSSEQEPDDSFEWLENLGVEQGTGSEGLLPKLEERLEQEPQSEAQATAFEAQQPPVTTSPAANLDELGKSEQERDDSFAWLENLAAKQGASEGLLTKPEERLEQEPEWVRRAKDLDAQPAAVSITPEVEPEQPVSLGDTDAWLGSLDEEKPSEPVPVEDEVETWLGDLEGTEVRAADQPAESVDADMPSWMKDIEKEEAPSAEAVIPDKEAQEESEWTSPAEEPVAFTESGTGEALPSWLSELDEEETISKPTDGDDLPAWLRGEDTAPQQAEPTRATDWKPVEEPQPRIIYSPPLEEEVEPAFELPEETEETEPAPLPPMTFEVPEEKPMVEAQEQPLPVSQAAQKPAAVPEPYREPVTTRRGAGMIAMPGTDPVLNLARNELSRSNITGALESYGKLIKRARFLEEVIHDLREALYRYPVDVSIWQALGDAYMRANRLQDALDAYTKAEELLR